MYWPNLVTPVLGADEGIVRQFWAEYLNILSELVGCSKNIQ